MARTPLFMQSFGFAMLAAVGGAAVGCNAVLGLSDFTDEAGSGGASATTTSNTSSTSAASTTSSTASTSTGTGGSGGQGACKKGDTAGCDTGHLGACAPGTKTCLDDESGFGPCVPNAEPMQNDDCMNMVDANCDGKLSCACTAGATESCMTGMPGACAAGTRTCLPDLTGYGDCIANMMATMKDDCVNMVDTNCNGMLDCACTPNAMQACTTALPGQCAPGTQTCAADGTAFGACTSKVGPSQEQCANPADENCDGFDCVEWNAQFGDNTNQTPYSIAIDAAGNVYAAGIFDGAIKHGNTTLIAQGSLDLFLLKYDPTGKPVWAKQFGDANAQYGGAVAVDSVGDLFFAGGSQSPIDLGGGNPLLGAGMVIAKFKSDGTYVWGKALGGTTCGFFPANVQSLAVAPGDNLVLAGTSGGSLNFGAGSVATAGGCDGFVAKLRGLDGSGTAAAGGWLKVFGDATDQFADGVAVDSVGNVILLGDFEGSVNLGLGAVTSAGNYDVLLAKLTGAGVPVWNKNFGDAKQQNAGNVTVDDLGSIVLTGTFDGSISFGGSTFTNVTPQVDGYIAKFNTAGTHQWSKAYPDAGVFAAADTAGLGNILVGGGFNTTIDLGNGPLTSAGNQDVILGKLTSNGTALWSKRYGDAAQQYIDSLIFVPNGDGIAAFALYGSMNLGAGMLTSAGGEDGVVARFGE